MIEDSKSNPTRQVEVKPNGRVYLNLPSGLYQGRRFLGIIRDRVFKCERDPERHFMRTIGAYGFNYELMNLPLFDEVEVNLTNGEILRTSRQHILKHGSVLGFKKRGFEVQVFLMLKRFNNPEQLSLFNSVAA